MTEVAAANSYGPTAAKAAAAQVQRKFRVSTDTFLPAPGNPDALPGSFQRRPGHGGIYEPGCPVYNAGKGNQTAADPGGLCCLQAPVKALTLLNKTVEVLDENGRFSAGRLQLTL